MSDLNDPDFADLVAATMDAEPELLPLLPELFADLEDLGARAEDVLAVLRHAALPSMARALDLGCGKGAAALAVAEAFGLSVCGVDAVPAFVTHARAQAKARDLAARCDFELGDVRGWVWDRAGNEDGGGDGDAGGFDLVMMLALGDLLGDTAETVAALRRCVRPGGYMLIDDAYLAPDADADEAADAALVGCQEHTTILASLCAHGDTVVHERVVDGPEDRAFYLEMTERVGRRCEALAAQHPALAELLRDFAERQRDDVSLLSGPVVGAMWLLRRGE